MGGYAMKYYVFDTEQEAINAEAAISQMGNVPITGVNQKTGELEPTKQKTVRWAVIKQRNDGKWVFPVVPQSIIDQYPSGTSEAFNDNFPHTKEDYHYTWFFEE